MRLAAGLLLPLLAAAMAGCSHGLPAPIAAAARTATGVSAHLLCDDVFISGLPAEQSIGQRVAPLLGGSLAWAMRSEVDAAQQAVTVTLAGGFASRAQRRPGLGCQVNPIGTTATNAPAQAVPAQAAASALPRAPQAGVQAVLDHALAPPIPVPHRHDKALVALHDGHLIAEAYAPGITAQTPLLGFSATKTVVNALIGVLVQQGRLALELPAPVPEWASTTDPRHPITVAQLLRQTSGLDLPQDNSGFDTTSRTMYTVADKAAAFAAAPLAHAPGTHWAYTDGHFMLLSRILRQATGGPTAKVLAFAQQALFGPLGMQQVVWDVDTSGTPMGASHLLASATDWARLGQLFLDDGMVQGQRLLPEGWVRWSTTPTLETGYGAGLWTNRQPGRVPGWGAPWGLSKAPADAFFARGFMGQFVVVVPSRRLVLVRLGTSPRHGDDIEGTDALVGQVLQALVDAPLAN